MALMTDYLRHQAEKSKHDLKSIMCNDDLKRLPLPNSYRYEELIETL